MTSTQLLTSFQDTSQLDVFKCALLFEKIETEKENYPDDPEKVHTKQKLFAMKRGLLKNFSEKYPNLQAYRSNVDLKTVENLLAEKKLKMRIWRQNETGRKKSIYLEYESPTDDEQLDLYRDLNVISHNFDMFKNHDFSDLALILDIDKFCKVRTIDHTKDRILFRQMTFFQAAVTERFPNLQGTKFHAKVAEFEKTWGDDSFFLGDTKRFYQTFGLGVQIWTKKSKPNRHYEVRKVWDCIYEKKFRIQIDDFTDMDRIPLKMNLFYIFDDSVINYFSCPNRHCFFGTHRQDRLATHIRGCVTTTKVIYQQKKFEKPDNVAREQLFEEKILPTPNYNNMMYGVYDIGKLLFSLNFICISFLV